MLDHLSASSIGQFLDCQMRFFFNKCQGIKAPPGIALVQGSSYHAGVELNYVAKIESHEDLPIDEVLDAVHDGYEERVGDVDFSQAGDDDIKTPAEGLDQTIALAKVWHKELAPLVQPISVERKFTLEHLDWQLPLIGRTDVDTAEGVNDNKTSGKKKTQTDLDADVQANIYLMERVVNGLEPHFEWHVAVKNKTPTTQVVTRTVYDHEFVVRQIKVVQEAIDQAMQSGIFLPCQPTWWGCSPKWCGFWNICPYHAR